jgi:hypothetical protein
VKGRELPFSWWRTFAGDIPSTMSTVLAGSLHSNGALVISRWKKIALP